MKKYITARPETIVSIVQFGRFPSRLPTYLEGSRLILFDTVNLALKEIHTLLDQIFIIEVNELRASVSSADDQKNQVRSAGGATIIATESIEKIICYSEKGNNLLKRLLKDIRPPNIEINAAIFLTPQTEHKHKIEGLSTDLPEKKPRITLESNSSILFQPSPPYINQQTNCTSAFASSSLNARVAKNSNTTTSSSNSAALFSHTGT